MYKALRWGWLFLAALLVPVAHAEIVELNLPSNLVAKAEFVKGNPNKPVILLLHGFLQTHNFPTISRLTESLAGEGFTVLAPTLSLGSTHRAQSMACEALHTETINDTVKELHEWVKWLKAKGYKRIVLAGHSLGNVTNVAYLSSHPDTSIIKFIGISMVEGRLKLSDAERSALISELRKKVHRHDRSIQKNQFSFCQKLHSTPDSILSYLEWGPEKLLQAIKKSPIPSTMIMGSKDDRLGPDWTPRLKKTNAKVIVIEGANHFMDGQFEFDLLDHMLDELKGL